MYQRQQQGAQKPKTPDIGIVYNKTSAKGLDYKRLQINLDEFFKLEAVLAYMKAGIGSGGPLSKLNLSIFDRKDPKTKDTQPDSYVKKPLSVGGSKPQYARSNNGPVASTGSNPWD